MTRRAAVAALCGACRIPCLAQGDIEVRLNRTNQLLIPVRVNGKGPLWCLLDTGGARFLYLDPEKAATLGIAASSTTQTAGPIDPANHATGVALATLDSAGLHLDRQEVLLKKTSPGDDGLIGAALFVPSIVELDFRTPAVRFHAGTFRYAGPGAAVPFEIWSFNPHIEASLDLGGAPVAARLTVDTGAPFGAAYLTPKFDSALRAQGRVLPWIRERNGFSTCRIAGLSVGRFSMAQPVIHLLPTQGFGGAAGAPDGVVGVDFLQRFRIFLDYTKQQLILEPNPGAPPVQKIDLARLIKPDGLVQDDFTPVSLRLPAGWSLVSGERWGDHETTLRLRSPGADIRLYYQFPLNPSTAPPDLGSHKLAIPAKTTKALLAADSAEALRAAEPIVSALTLL